MWKSGDHRPDLFCWFEAQFPNTPPPAPYRKAHNGRMDERNEDPYWFWPRVGLWAAFAVWGLVLIRMDYRTGEIGASFLHRPLLIFHEAGHVVFRLFGEWMTIFGGTLGQLLMPTILCFALLRHNRDAYGASFGLWLLGVSLLDVAPYTYDALHPQLMLLSGTTGEAGGHDWIFLLSSMGLLGRAHGIGAFIHTLGAVVVLAGSAWGVWQLWAQHVRAVR